ncbi:Las1-like [Carpediemonas membranifera]|uniref:Las1-like n=1 Tax=Carpediemonas membranifera TaxID=201153 RepID=A0A8J6AU67_9EUKA|nr:Las1-like [Carpediemonas membranifera]|eukprot:KAG9391665.1 Las1-like [Carpediemonas membranifera]
MVIVVSDPRDEKSIPAKGTMCPSGLTSGAQNIAEKHFVEAILPESFGELPPSADDYIYEFKLEDVKEEGAATSKRISRTTSSFKLHDDTLLQEELQKIEDKLRENEFDRHQFQDNPVTLDKLKAQHSQLLRQRAEIQQQIDISMKTRRVPFRNWEEWDLVIAAFTREESLLSMDDAMTFLESWVRRGTCPLAIEIFARITYTLASAVMNQQVMLDVRDAALGLYIIRFVNGVTEPLQKAQYARSLAKIARDVGLSSSLVDSRNSLTHRAMPTHEEVAKAAAEIREYIHAEYLCDQYTELQCTTRDVCAMLQSGSNTPADRQTKEGQKRSRGLVTAADVVSVLVPYSPASEKQDMVDSNTVPPDSFEVAVLGLGIDAAGPAGFTVGAVRGWLWDEDTLGQADESLVASGDCDLFSTQLLVTLVSKTIDGIISIDMCESWLDMIMPDGQYNTVLSSMPIDAWRHIPETTRVAIGQESSGALQGIHDRLTEAFGELDTSAPEPQGLWTQAPEYAGQTMVLWDEWGFQAESESQSESEAESEHESEPDSSPQSDSSDDEFQSMWAPAKRART